MTVTSPCGIDPVEDGPNSLGSGLRDVAKWIRARDPLATNYLFCLQAADLLDTPTIKRRTPLMADSGLLPCPFCGSAPNIVPADPSKAGDDWTYIVCRSTECAATPGVTVHADGAHRAEATAVWNRRTPPMTDRPDDGALAYNPIDVKQERAAFDTWWRMWCPDRGKPGPHVFDAWLARARHRLAASPAQVARAPDRAGVEELIENAKHHIAYLRSFDKQPLARSVELMEGLIAALSATPSREGER